MTTKTARFIIRKEYGDSKNFMTDRVLKMGKINKNMAYELSSGRGFTDNIIYGISIVELLADGKTKRRTDLAECCYSINEAESYIRDLKEDFKIKR